MTLEQQLGAQLVLGFSGTEATDELIRDLSSLHAQSIILFERNFISPEQTKQLILRLEEALGNKLLVMVDHEGGRVIRFKYGLTQFPDALSLGRAKSSADIEQQGCIEAKELRALGIYVNLAPCVDVIVEGCDPIIGDRSYGSDPANVIKLGVARIRGLQSSGVAACAKHFPGLGAVGRDPHKSLPTISLGYHEMDAVHWPPFRAAIKADVATIMSSHVCYPGLEEPKGLPATFSTRLIHGLLRERFRFQGVILSDDLEMGALSSFGDFGEIAKQTIAAGHDMLLICSDLRLAKKALSHLCSTYKNRLLSEDKLEYSLKRIEELRKNFLSQTLEY